MRLHNDVYLTTAEAVAYLRTAPRTLYRFLASGQIPAVRMGRQWRFRKADLDRWVEKRPGHLTAEAKTSSPVIRGRARRVLVADDEASVRHLLAGIFEAAEYEVEAVGDGLTAIARLREASFDLLVTDLAMPQVGGIELAREARRFWPAIKIMVLTGYPSQSSAIEALNIGVDGYFTKPFSAAELLTAAVRAFEPGSAIGASISTKVPLRNSRLVTRL
jgi:excisionase family DNA binding protein